MEQNQNRSGPTLPAVGGTKGLNILMLPQPFIDVVFQNGVILMGTVTFAVDNQYASITRFYAMMQKNQQLPLRLNTG